MAPIPKTMSDQEFSRLWHGARAVLAREIKQWVIDPNPAKSKTVVLPAGTVVEVARPRDYRKNADKRVRWALGPNWMCAGRVAGSGTPYEITLTPKDLAAGSTQRPERKPRPGEEV